MPYSLVGDLLARAGGQPGAPALLWHRGVTTFGELAGQARSAAVELSAGRGPVVLTDKKSPASIALILACLMVGRPALLPAADLGIRTRELLIERAQKPPPQNTCLLLTTSGSTGTPKIVPLSRGAVDRFTEWAGSAFALGPGTTVLNYAPLNFDLCLLDVWATLRSGGCVVLVDQDRAVNSRYLHDLLITTGPNVIQAVPLLFRILAEAGDAAFPTVRHVLLTGDHASRRTRAALPRLFPNAGFHNVYGCTETNDSFMYSFGAEEAIAREVLPLGRPLPGVRATVLREAGELMVRTPFQATCYLHEDEREERFITRNGRAWFRTGDVVSRDSDGALTLIGRTDLQVKVRGVRVNIEEIERVILDHEQVREAAVVALPDADAGQRLHAVVRRSSHELTELRVREHCAARLSRAGIPAVFHLVEESLPTTSTGKVSRRRIRDGLRKGSA